MEARAGLPTEHRLHPGFGEQVVLALLCICAGAIPLAVRWVSSDVTTRIADGVLVATVYLAFTLFARKASSLRPFWELSFAFFVLAVVQVLNNSIPSYVGANIMRAPPNAGNPMAATVAATVVVQLLGTIVAIVPVVVLTLASGRDLGSIDARYGKPGRWLALGIIFFVAVYLFVATLPLRPDSPAHQLLPTNGTMTVARFLALTPALLVMAISNGFEEEFLFRGLFLQKYSAIFGFGAANVLQAVVFSIAHAGVTYTPSALFFIVALIFPLGLFFGYLMRKTDGIVAPSIFHAGVDLAIYVAFLSYVA